MVWKLSKPTAATADGWADWKEQSKANFPVRFFLQETMPDFFRYNIINPYFYWPARNLKWGIIHRFHPSHRYHVVKPRTLKPGYIDPRAMLLHANMELLVGFIEEAKDHIDWEDDERHSNAWREMNEVADWWQNEWPHRYENCVTGERMPVSPKLPKEWGFMAPLRDKYRNTPEMIEWKRVSDIRSKEEEKWTELEEAMLLRIIEIRLFMWS